MGIQEQTNTIIKAAL